VEVFQSLQTKRFICGDDDYDVKQKFTHYYLMERVGVAVTLSSRNREIIEIQNRFLLSPFPHIHESYHSTL
jgi:hypothetical protein